MTDQARRSLNGRNCTRPTGALRAPPLTEETSHPLNLLQGSLPGAQDAGRLAGLPVCRAEPTLRHLRWGCQKAWPAAYERIDPWGLWFGHLPQVSSQLGRSLATERVAQGRPSTLQSGCSPSVPWQELAGHPLHLDVRGLAFMWAGRVVGVTEGIQKCRRMRGAIGRLPEGLQLGF